MVETQPNNVNQKKSGKSLVGCLIPVLIIFIILFIPVGMRVIGGILIIADPLKKADAAVALSGDSGERILEAVQLFKDGYVNKIFITFTDETAVRNLESDAAKQGIPYKKMFVTKMEVSDTVGEARAIRELALDKEAKSIIVITDPFHTFRTRLIFRRELRGSGIDIQVRPVRDHWYKSNTWWKTPEGIQYTSQEYLKSFLFIFGVH